MTNKPDPYPFHRQGDCKGYTPPPAPEPRQHWLVTVAVIVGYGIILAGCVAIALPLLMWAVGPR